jgi:hypothetical protein
MSFGCITGGRRIAKGIDASSTMIFIQCNRSVRFTSLEGDSVGNAAFNHKRGNSINNTITKVTARVAKSEYISKLTPNIQRYLQDHKSNDNTK